MNVRETNKYSATGTPALAIDSVNKKPNLPRKLANEETSEKEDDDKYLFKTKRRVSSNTPDEQN